ncbi:hypothetical protein T492DRAFT_1135222 [Pavlovales sp. CCMP2436]|nr:hypothetical protein T492DRAFT_1135222 [Pavlovales sp. CCMP2436]
MCYIFYSILFYSIYNNSQNLGAHAQWALAAERARPDICAPCRAEGGAGGCTDVSVEYAVSFGPSLMSAEPLTESVLRVRAPPLTLQMAQLGRKQGATIALPLGICWRVKRCATCMGLEIAAGAAAAARGDEEPFMYALPPSNKGALGKRTAHPVHHKPSNTSTDAVAVSPTANPAAIATRDGGGAGSASVAGVRSPEGGGHARRSEHMGASQADSSLSGELAGSGGRRSTRASDKNSDKKRRAALKMKGTSGMGEDNDDSEGEGEEGELGLPALRRTSCSPRSSSMSPPPAPPGTFDEADEAAADLLPFAPTDPAVSEAWRKVARTVAEATAAAACKAPAGAAARRAPAGAGAGPGLIAGAGGSGGSGGSGPPGQVRGGGGGGAAADGLAFAPGRQHHELVRRVQDTWRQRRNKRRAVASIEQAYQTYRFHTAAAEAAQAATAASRATTARGGAGGRAVKRCASRGGLHDGTAASDFAAGVAAGGAGFGAGGRLGGGGGLRGGLGGGGGLGGRADDGSMGDAMRLNYRFHLERREWAAARIRRALVTIVRSEATATGRAGGVGGGADARGLDAAVRAAVGGMGGGARAIGRAQHAAAVAHPMVVEPLPRKSS